MMAEDIFDNKHCVYVFLIAVLHGCTLEKAKALYEGEKVWVSPEMVDEMAEMYKTMNMQEIAEVFGLKRQQVGLFLQQWREEQEKRRKGKENEKGETGDDGKTDAGQGGVAETSE